MEVAREYCDFIEKRDSFSEIETYQIAFRLLPRLFVNGMNLPDIFRFEYYNVYKCKEWAEVYHSFRKKLSRANDEYPFVFDPYNDFLPQNNKKSQEDWKKPIFSSLSDNLASIYDELLCGLKDWEASDNNVRRGIIWAWKWGFENHWGRHAADTITALHCLLFQHIRNEYGDAVGLIPQVIDK
jgi:hypothetical protein